MSDTETTAADRLTTDLQHAILRGDYAAGAKLPPERDLALQYRVNRVTVRGALARLESMNLVTIRHGSGCVVQDFKRSGGLDLVAALIRARADSGAEAADLAADLLELRRALARAVLERLAASGNARDTKAISAAVDALEAVVAAEAPLDGIARADLEVFRRIVEATGSVVYMLCLNPISELVLSLPGLAEAIYAEPHKNVMSYRLLVSWLPLHKASTIEPLVAALEVHDRAAVKAMRRMRPAGKSKR